MAKVAIMGYGTVGSGVYDIIKTNSDKLSRSANGESVDIKYILDIRDFDDHYRICNHIIGNLRQQFRLHPGKYAKKECWYLFTK